MTNIDSIDMPFQQSDSIRYFQFDRIQARHAIFTRQGGLSPQPWNSLNVGGTVGDELTRVRANRNPNEMIEDEASFGERIADSVAGFGGSWTFILSFLGTLAIYTAVNVVLGRSAWDPYPFILLNLMLSMLAALQAPVIMMSQNRQAAKDRNDAKLDYEVNVRAETEIARLHEKIDQRDVQMQELLEINLRQMRLLERLLPGEASR